MTILYNEFYENEQHFKRRVRHCVARLERLRRECLPGRDCRCTGRGGFLRHLPNGDPSPLSPLATRWLRRINQACLTLAR